MAKSTNSGTIKLKPGNAGKLRATAGVSKGKKIPISTLHKLANSGNKTTAKRAQFALNAKKFKH